MYVSMCVVYMVFTIGICISDFMCKVVKANCRTYSAKEKKSGKEETNIQQCLNSSEHKKKGSKEFVHAFKKWNKKGEWWIGPKKK